MHGLFLRVQTPKTPHAYRPMECLTTPSMEINGLLQELLPTEISG